MSKFSFFIALPFGADLGEYAAKMPGLEVELRASSGVYHMQVMKVQEFTVSVLDKEVEEDRGTYYFNAYKVGVQDSESGFMLSGTKCDLYCVNPQGYSKDGKKVDYNDWGCGPAMFRKLARFEKDTSNKSFIMGPWSAMELERQFGAVVDSVLYEMKPDKMEEIPDSDGLMQPISWVVDKSKGRKVPWGYAGDDVHALAEIDYAPSSRDVDDDVKIAYDALFPAPAELETP